MTTVNTRNISPPSGKGEDSKQKSFFNRPRVGGKTIWDWLQLLIIPLVLALLTFGLGFEQNRINDANSAHQTMLQQTATAQQHDADQQRALDQQQADTLQKYMDSIQDLLINGNLLKSKPDGDAAILARARTLTALQGLDTERKSLLVQFLYDAKLIGFLENSSNDPVKLIVDPAIISLSRADLSRVHFSGDLSGADFSGIDPNLNGARLSGAIFSNTKLEDTNFSEANLSGADLSGTDLIGTDLSGAYLSGAYLQGNPNLTQEQLNQVHSCKRATLPLPPILKCHKNQ